MRIKNTKKAALIIEPRKCDQYFIEALDKLGYSVFGVAINYPFSFGLEPVFQSKKLKNIYLDYRYTLLSDFKYQLSNYSKIINEKNISLICPSIFITHIFCLITGFLNQTYNLSGINQQLSRFWLRKSRYLKYFSQKGIKTPHVFQTVSTQEKPDLSLITKFPVICKPDCGNGGNGVFLARDPKELYKLFEPAPKNENIDEIEKWYRPRLKNGKTANYLFVNFNSKYIIEEFISGPLLSVVGIKAINGVEVSIIFEIESAEPPFRSENAFLAPFPDEEEGVKKAHSLVSRIVKDSVFPYGPFIFDFILDSNKELYLLDASPRSSSTAVEFFKPCYLDESYAERSLRALLNQKIEIQERGNPKAYIYLKNLPLPKGYLLEFSQKEAFSDYVVNWNFSLYPGDQIFRDRNDALSKHRGHLAVIGNSAQQAKNRWFKEFKKLKFSIKEDMRPI